MSKRINLYLQTLGMNIRTIRFEKGLSQESFAEIVDLDRSYMGSVERGERNVATLNLIKIATALEVTIGDLFDGI